MQAGFVDPPIEQVRALLAAMVGRRVVVIGDAMLDAYLFGRVSRISPEAPVPVVAVEREERLLGGAANVAKCLVALGAQARLCAVVGADAEGELLLKEARALGVEVSGVITDPSRPTTQKRRVVGPRQQMVRLDYESRAPLGPAIELRLVAAVRRAIRGSDAVVLSDYAKGVLTPAVCRAALSSAGGRPVVVDPKTQGWERFAGATVFKPNRREVAACLGLEVDRDADAARAARRIQRRLRVRSVLLTRGEHGMTLATRGTLTPSLGGAGGAIHSRGLGSKCHSGGRAGVLHLPAHRREVFDVTGAGDVVAATLALALAAGADLRLAAWLANVAAGVKVTKFGAAAVSEAELLEALGHGALDCERKVLTRAQAAALAARLRRQGRKLVFTNGCFDILHYGHVSLLERARRLGDALIVGVNSDASVRRLKGPGRPVQPERDRALTLAAQACVDAVVVFDEDTPRELIRALRPEVLCKGADYQHKKNVVGWDLVAGWGGRVVLVSLEAGRSTSAILRRLK